MTQMTLIGMADMAKTEDRFIETYVQGGIVSQQVKILVDKQRGVNYLYTAKGYAGGLTPLLNRDGTPVVTPVRSAYDE